MAFLFTSSLMTTTVSFAGHPYLPPRYSLGCSWFCMVYFQARWLGDERDQG